ncbi:uncharacterized protein LOC120456996 [Drosophila santomea]|uniref:uncharacterized protein LOC120456996 n=1 Tax=Drosophila santomea TaxID=129105 RepID=UPI001953C632|nr:uncharacterized protein LOC120456996 [Drosophila santomea]
MPVNNISGIKLSSGPTHLRSRILVRNLPTCTRHELARLCIPFGEILGSLVLGNHGFIQFARESDAKTAIQILDQSIFKSKLILVSSASFRSLRASKTTFGPVEKEEHDRVA